MLRTIHSANQLGIYGAVASWCIDLAEKVHGQTSTGVRTVCEEAGMHYSWIHIEMGLVGDLSSVIMADMEIQPLHLQTTPMFVWSHPAAHTDTCTSYDTEIQKILVKELITNACRTRIMSKRLFNWKCQTITFRFMNGNGKTSWPMNSVTDTRGNLRSRNLSVNWYDMKIIETQKQMEQNNGNRKSEAQIYVPQAWKP